MDALERVEGKAPGAVTHWTREEFEAIEVKIAGTREAFLRELSKHRELSRLYAELHELEQMEIDARRARREGEIMEGACL